MNIRNRMADVKKLRCNACQDYIKMLLNDNWQQELYNLAKQEVMNNTPQKNRYIAAYEKMRDFGFENYSVDNMDVTFITTIVDAKSHNKFNAIKAVHDNTYKSLIQLRDDRNFTNHSDENEEPDELYLRGLLALCNLRNFVKIVDKYELSIEDKERLAYRQKYIPKIESLKDLLDEERIEQIQWKKQIDKKLRKVLESDNPSSEFGYVNEYVLNKYKEMRREKNEQSLEILPYFEIKASDYGISDAHLSAASFFIEESNFTEAERRILMWYDSVKELNKNNVNDVKCFIDRINYLTKQKSEITPKLQKIIDDIIDKGFEIQKTQEGLLKIDVKKYF